MKGLKGTTRKITSQGGGFLDFLKPSMTTGGLALMKNVLTPLARSTLTLLGLTAAASASHAAIQKKMYGLEKTTLAFSNEVLNNTMKIVKSLETSSFLIQGVGETVENEAKEQRFPGM